MLIWLIRNIIVGSTEEKDLVDGLQDLLSVLLPMLLPLMRLIVHLGLELGLAPLLKVLEPGDHLNP